MIYKYWMVHRTGSTTSKTHHTLAEAEMEAARLARQYIGVSFNILEAMTSAIVSIPPVSVEKLRVAPMPAVNNPPL